jgi:hypothetical protein
MRAWIAFLPALALAAAAEEPAPRGSLLILHFRWKHDSLSLLDSRRVPAAVKTSRAAARARSAGPGRVDPAPASPFGYELVDSAGNAIAERFLDDPGVKHVEFQAPGDKTLRREERKLDSADVFVRVPEAGAKSIRFYRHRPAMGPEASMVPGPDREAMRKAGAAQGPEAPAARTLLAEFPLE